MSEPVSIFETIDENAVAAAIAKARADIAAGRLVPHETVVEWLRSWGTPNELPCPIPPEILSEVYWTVSALADLEEIRRYVAEFNPEAARNLAANLIAAGNSLIALPHSGRSGGDNIRELTTVYPYIIRYEVAGGMVRILRVRHGMRRQ